MSEEGLIHAVVLNGVGGSRELDWAGVRGWTLEKGPIWVHLDYSSEASRNWLEMESKVGALVAEALLSEETRPRTTLIGDAVLLSLRGVNLNPGEEPEDMVSIRMCVTGHRIISTRRRTLLSVRDIVESLKAGTGPKTTGEFLVDFTSRITSRMEEVVESLEDRVAGLEENVILSASQVLRHELSSARREIIMVHRYLAPQRDAMTKLHTVQVPWLDESCRMHLREVTDQVMRYVEDLDSIRDRASVTQEELVNRLSEQLNSRMYVLSMVAALFMPLGFFTGLLGTNVGGIPGSQNQWGFTVFVAILLVVSALQLYFFRRKKWL
jgi:zinc transporter